MNETELLFTETLNCDRASLYLDRKRTLKPEEASFIKSALERRVCGEPIQYILGKAEFMGLEFKVTPDVLIPRPETELLVEGVISRASGSSILDVGTGSGCIAVALAKFLPAAEITAIDISEKAIAVAKENARMHDAGINLLQSDLFAGYEIRDARYEIIVSNPPYVPSAEITKLQREIQYEPRLALDGGEDGLDFCRRLIFEAPIHLKDSGLLMLEIGFDQAGEVRNIFQKSGVFEIIGITRDYSNIDRIITARKKWTD